MPPPLDLQAATVDPEFQALPPAQQNRFLFENDPEARSQFFAEGEKAYKLPPGTLGAVWATESGPGTKPSTVVSPTGVRGPFQITQQFWKDFGEGAYTTDPLAQLQAAGKGLAHYLQVHAGDLSAALNHYRNGSLDPSNKLADPGYAGRVLARIPKTLQAPEPTEATTIQPSAEPTPRIMTAELSNAPTPPPGMLNALGQTTGAYLQRGEKDVEAFFDHPSLSNWLKVMSPALSPGGYLGEIAAGTRARMKGFTPEDTAHQEQVGNVIGSIGQAGVGSLARRLAPLSGDVAPTSLEGLIPGGAKVSQPSTEAINAARDYLTPLRTKLANNPSALQAVETAAAKRFGPDVLGALDPTTTQASALPFSPQLEKAAGKLGKVIAGSTEHLLGAGVGAALGHQFGHGALGAILGERILPMIISGAVKTGTTIGKTATTLATENPQAAANVIGKVGETAGPRGFIPVSQFPYPVNPYPTRSKNPE